MAPKPNQRAPNHQQQRRLRPSPLLAHQRKGH